MRLVQDQLFVETLSFKLPADVARRVMHSQRSMAECMSEACAAVGLELIDYECGVVSWTAPEIARVELFSRRSVWPRGH